MVFNHSRQAMVITNRQGNILRVNSAFTEVTGYASEEAIGKTPRILKSRRQDEQFTQNSGKVCSKRASGLGKSGTGKKAGKAMPAICGFPRSGTSKAKIRYFVGVSDDITLQMLALNDDSQPDNIDILTELPNRRLFREKFAHSLRQAQLYGGLVALLLLDLDDFWRVNGTLGYQTGDSQLR